ncbi:MAG: diguanylate cyclase [Campylobacterales bacterium]|nr:diguanylate cyclase [Campylobacterales bacterium]
MQNELGSVNFTKRYAFALTLIAILSSAAFFTLHLALQTSESTALIVNISGKQRMLSQRVASTAQHYYSHLHNKESNDVKRVKAFLVSSMNEMQEANEKLSSGHLSENVTVELSATIHDFYFGKMNVKKRVDDYFTMGSVILTNEDDVTIGILVHELVLASDALLPDLNSIVSQYQKEGEESINKIKTIELIAWIITLFTLLVEVIFIFQPMANTLSKLFQNEQWIKNNLEQEIQIRTYHLEQVNEKLKYSASHDPLTGLNNRLNLEMELEKLLAHYKENHIPFAVLMLDIDWFKKVNDAYGHHVGDYVLKEVSLLITQIIRKEDSAYRAGGEEFVIILNRISQLRAMEKAEEIRSAIENHSFSSDEDNFNITMSCGIYHTSSLKVQDTHDILKIADSALYEAKHAGRNRVVMAQSSCQI